MRYFQQFLKFIDYKIHNAHHYYIYLFIAILNNIFMMHPTISTP